MSLTQSYQELESRESSTGAKLLTNYGRGLVPIDGSGNLPPGLSTQFITLPVALVKPLDPAAPVPGLWPIRQFLRYRFAGSLRVQTSGPDKVSLESASMRLFSFGVLVTRGNAARLSSTTALAENQTISFDDWLIDCSDLLSMRIQAGAANNGVPANQSNSFTLQMILTFNNSGGGIFQASMKGEFQVAAAQFNGYRFEKWE